MTDKATVNKVEGLPKLDHKALTTETPVQTAPDLGHILAHPPAQPLPPRTIQAIQASHGNRFAQRFLESASAPQRTSFGGLPAQFMQRYIQDNDKPENVMQNRQARTLEAITNYVTTRPVWPRPIDPATQKYTPDAKQAMDTFVAHIDTTKNQYDNGLVSAVTTAWSKYLQAQQTQNAGTMYTKLGLVVTALNTFVDQTRANPSKIVKIDTDKLKYIQETVDYLHPRSQALQDILGRMGVHRNVLTGVTTTYQVYVDAIKSILDEPRMLRSFKGTDSPYSMNIKDDDRDANLRLIVDYINKQYGDKRSFPKQYETPERPGTTMEWQEWRGKDCVFAAILYNMTEVERDDESEEERIETNIAETLEVKTSIVDDPILLLIMKRLGWNYQPDLTWATFQQTADITKTYVISYDIIVSGAQAHTVVAKHDGNKWGIYDRQGIRLNAGGKEPAHPNNLLSAWEVDVEAAQTVLGDLQ